MAAMVDKDVIIEQLMQRDAAKDQRIDELESIVEQLQETIVALQDQLARAKKNSSNSSMPPSTDIAGSEPPKKSNRKRKRGGQKGHKRCVREPFPPEQVDTFEIHTLPTDEIKRRSLIPLDETKMLLQQIDLPEKLFNVIEHRVQLYRTPNGKIVSAKLPKEIRKAGLFTPRMQALCGYFKARCHMSYTTISECFKNIFGFPVTNAHICNVCLNKVSPALLEGYEQALAAVRTSPAVGTDETGHNNAGDLHWIWCQQSPAVVFFHIDKSRGSQVLEKILGKDFAGAIMADYLSANRKFIRDNEILAQFCWSHLLRDITSLTESIFKTVGRWADALLEISRKIFEVYNDRENRPRWRNTLEKIKKTFLQKVRRPPDYHDAKVLARRFKGAQGEQDYFLFLDMPEIAPTNNASERDIRHVVIDRLVTMGTRSWAGMRFCERTWTIAATCARHGKSVFEFIEAALNSTYNGTPYPQLIP